MIRMPKMKTYRYSSAMMPTVIAQAVNAERAQSGDRRRTVQGTGIVHTTTKKRAAELFKVSLYELDRMGESYSKGDADNPAAVMQPETVLWLPLDTVDRDYRLWYVDEHGQPQRALYDPAAAQLRALAVKLYAAHEQFTIEHAQQQIDRFDELSVQWERTARAATEHFRSVKR